jgi:hypothetical protein
VHRLAAFVPTQTCPKFEPRMGQTGRIGPIASPCWRRRKRRVGPFGPVRMRANHMRQPARAVSWIQIPFDLAYQVANIKSAMSSPLLFRLQAALVARCMFVGKAIFSIFFLFYKMCPIVQIKSYEIVFFAREHILISRRY